MSIPVKSNEKKESRGRKRKSRGYISESERVDGSSSRRNTIRITDESITRNFDGTAAKKTTIHDYKLTPPLLLVRENTGSTNLKASRWREEYVTPRSQNTTLRFKPGKEIPDSFELDHILANDTPLTDGGIESENYGTESATSEIDTLSNVSDGLTTDGEDMNATQEQTTSNTRAEGEKDNINRKIRTQKKEVSVLSPKLTLMKHY